LGILVVAAVIVTVLGFIVMSLWNALIPGLFGGPALRFGQALGLLALSRILFGGFRGFRGCAGHGWRRRMAMREQWEAMTPEERERFREGFRRWRHARHSDPIG
jgi:hypothetical protein